MISEIKIKIKNIFGIYLSTLEDSRRLAAVFHILFISIFTVFIIYFGFLSTPADFPEKILFPLQKGQTLGETASLLEEQNIIKSDFWFKKVVIFLGGEADIRAGDYFFEEPQSAYNVAKRIISGKFDLSPVKVTVPEGFNIYEIAILFESRLPEFNKTKFIMLASQKEGFLFPDTYFFSHSAKIEDIILAMEDNFKSRLESIMVELENFNKPLEEIVSMASIVEKESKTMESRKIIAGILWKRIEIGMPLQVDVAFKYINGKNTYELTSDDLKIDSPYNTYNRLGLPPTPISNPGIEAILATIEPEDTDYLYFLSDRNGDMHYAVTHEEHVENKLKYLNLR